MKCVRAIYEKALRLLQREQSLKHTAEKPRFLDQKSKLILKISELELFENISIDF